MTKQHRYKLTDQDTQTHDSTQWKVGEWKETSGEGQLCTKGWLHCYCNPLLAVLHNPIHANILTPQLWRVEVSGKCLRDGDLKEGWTRMRLIEIIKLPRPTREQKIAYSILCALEVSEKIKFITWANRWLDGTDRSYSTACDIAYATYAADTTATYAAADAIAYAAYAADAAAYATAYAAATRKKSLNLVHIAEKAVSLY